MTSPRGRFELGEQANDLVHDADTLLQEVEDQASEWECKTHEVLEVYETYFAGQIGAAQAERQRMQAAAGASVWRRIISRLAREDRRYQEEIEGLEKQRAKLFDRSRAAKEAELNRLLGRAGQVVLMLRRLRDILSDGYQSTYDSAGKNAQWLGIDMTEFRTAKQLESIVQEQEAGLGAVLLMCARKAKQLSICVDPKVLSALQSYPAFASELGLPEKP